MEQMGLGAGENFAVVVRRQIAKIKPSPSTLYSAPRIREYDLGVRSQQL